MTTDEFTQENDIWEDYNNHIANYRHMRNLYEEDIKM